MRNQVATYFHCTNATFDEAHRMRSCIAFDVPSKAGFLAVAPNWVLMHSTETQRNFHYYSLLSNTLRFANAKTLIKANTKLLFFENHYFIKLLKNFPWLNAVKPSLSSLSFCAESTVNAHVIAPR